MGVFAKIGKYFAGRKGGGACYEVPAFNHSCEILCKGNIFPNLFVSRFLWETEGDAEFNIWVDAG